MSFNNSVSLKFVSRKKVNLFIRERRRKETNNRVICLNRYLGSVWRDSSTEIIHPSFRLDEQRPPELHYTLRQKQRRRRGRSSAEERSTGGKERGEKALKALSLKLQPSAAGVDIINHDHRTLISLKGNWFKEKKPQISCRLSLLYINDSVITNGDCMLIALQPPFTPTSLALRLARLCPGVLSFSFWS